MIKSSTSARRRESYRRTIADALVAAGFKGTRANLAAFVDVTLNEIAAIVVTEGRIELRGFGTFEIRTRGDGAVKMPNGRVVPLAGRKRVAFRPGMYLRGKYLSPE